jgi:hypothetical protein
VLLESLGVPSLAMTVAAMPWIVDPRFPHSPDNVATGDFGVDVPEDLWKEDEGVQVAFRRDEEAAPEYTFGAGDPFLDVPLLCPLSLPSAEYMSSSTEISRRVRGRNVELLLEVDSEEPLEGFMACGGRADVVKVGLHRPSDWSGREAAWHEAHSDIACSIYRERWRCDVWMLGCG